MKHNCFLNMWFSRWPLVYLRKFFRFCIRQRGGTYSTFYVSARALTEGDVPKARAQIYGVHLHWRRDLATFDTLTPMQMYGVNLNARAGTWRTSSWPNLPQLLRQMRLAQKFVMSTDFCTWSSLIRHSTATIRSA